ncbi:MAG: phage major capsid protein [Ruminococcus sp.]|nr:phage major capsid protein [Ruminococcus sp.]
MTYEQQRAQLVAKAQEHINRGELDEAKKLMDQVRDLDAKHEEQLTAQANLDALNGERQVANAAAQLINPQGVQLTDGDPAPTDDMFNTLEYRQAFMNNMLKGTPIPVKFTNTDYTTTSTTAGTIVPTTLYEQIITKLENSGDIYARVFKTSFPTALVIPTLTVKPTATWVDEDKGSARQKFTTDKVQFAGYKLECKTAFSLFMATTSLEMFEAQFIAIISEAMIIAIETKIISGNGSGCPKGILAETPPTGQALELAAGSSGKLTYKLLMDAEAALPASYKNAVWLMTKKTFFAWVGITDQNGQPIARVNAGLSNSQEYTLNGRHVCCTDGYMGDFAETVSADTTFAAMFDLGYYVFNQVLGILLKKYVDEDTDNVILKAVMLGDGKVIDKNSLVTITKKAASN